MFVPIYGNEALESYMNGARVAPSSDASNPTAPWQGPISTASPTLPNFSPWPNPQLAMPMMGNTPATTMMPGFPMHLNMSDWDSSSQMPQFHPNAPHPYMFGALPAFPAPGSNQLSNNTVPPHFRARLSHQNKRTPSHGADVDSNSGGSGGRGPTLQQMMKLNKQQQQQQPSFPGGGPPQRQSGSSNSAIPMMGGPRPIMPQVFSCPPYPFMIDPNAAAGTMLPPGAPFMMSGASPNYPTPPRPLVQNVNPAQWNILPAAYDNP